jgi:hypothetical protein
MTMKMLLRPATILFVFIAGFSMIPGSRVNAQISSADLKLMAKREDSLKGYAFKLINGINPSDRLIADSIFTKLFVRALKTRNSFYYPFDSLETISRLYSPDSSFRIITWQMVINDNVVRQHGAIQMRTPDGSLKLFPLIDKSDVTKKVQDTISNHLGWMGAVYYKIILTRHQQKPYYTLLGFDANNIRSNKKVIEVLSFENGLPLFGGRYFTVAAEGNATPNMARYIMEYKKEASPRLTYDRELEMIVMEHLVSETNEPKKKWTYIGDGDYEGFKWENGAWKHVNKIFNEITPEGKEPVPSPLSENKFNTTEKPTPATPPVRKKN